MNNLQEIQRKMAGMKNFDGNEATLKAQGVAQVNITISKSAATAGTFAELFCSGASAALVRVQEYGAVYTASFDFATGNLVFDYGVGPGTVTVGCSDIPYRWLLDFYTTNSSRIELIRMSVSTTAQYNFKLKPFRRSAFGATAGNNINPAAYRRPDQQQNDIVDIKASVPVDNENGLSFELAPAISIVGLSLFIPVYAKPNTVESQLGF